MEKSRPDRLSDRLSGESRALWIDRLRDALHLLILLPRKKLRLLHEKPSPEAGDSPVKDEALSRAKSFFQKRGMKPAEKEPSGQIPGGDREHHDPVSPKQPGIPQKRGIDRLPLPLSELRHRAERRVKEIIRRKIKEELLCRMNSEPSEDLLRFRPDPLQKLKLHPDSLSPAGGSRRKYPLCLPPQSVLLPVFPLL